MTSVTKNATKNEYSGKPDPYSVRTAYAPWSDPGATRWYVSHGPAGSPVHATVTSFEDLREGCDDPRNRRYSCHKYGSGRERQFLLDHGFYRLRLRKAAGGRP